MRTKYFALIAGFALCGALPFTARADTPPNDAQIAAIVVAANTVDIEAGQLAKTKTNDTAVQAFAERMIADHTSVNEQASDLVTKLGVKPEQSDTSRGLSADGKKMTEQLSKLSGKAFDKAYIDNEVAYHKAVLEMIDKILIPNAKNAELKALIVKVRPVIQTHLEHATKIQAALQ